ncbi:MAG: redoxin domain-containing protein, partial [Candidatus Eremiobacteraeota bacterium]|nr:redoxin domain-containing protein [Candidatus Eremiobacteraeota bacterium]
MRIISVIIIIIILLFGCQSQKRVTFSPAIPGPKQHQAILHRGTSVTGQQEHTSDEFKQVSIGDKVPDFTLPGIDGKIYRLSDYSGKVILLHFWSAACPVPKRYDKHLMELADRYGDDLRILIIDSTAHSDEYNTVFIKKEVDKRGLNLPVLIDKDNHIADIFN